MKLSGLICGGRLYAVTATVCLCLSAATGFSQSEKARNVVLFIGDGMGLGHVQYAVLKAHGHKIDKDGNPPRLSFEKFPVAGYLTNSPATGLVTDSAAAVTALATGHKTDNGTIGMDKDEKPVENISEIARKSGKAVGIVSSVGFDHATPAGFYAHAGKRSSLDQITSQVFETRTADVLIGGGICAKGWTDVMLQNAAARAGYKVFTCDTLEQFKAAPADGSKILGYFDVNNNDQMDCIAADNRDLREPALGDVAAKAVDFLLPDKEGFFLMVEAGAIDWASHGNNTTDTVGEVLELDRTVGLVIDKLQKNGVLDETLLIVTADHETGGLVIREPKEPKGAAGKQPKGAKKAKQAKKAVGVPEVFWNTKEHTAIPVMVWAQGPGAAKLAGKHDNTHVFRVMAEQFR